MIYLTGLDVTMLMYVIFKISSRILLILINSEWWE